MCALDQFKNYEQHYVKDLHKLVAREVSSEHIFGTLVFSLTQMHWVREGKMLKCHRSSTYHCWYGTFRLFERLPLISVDLQAM